MCYDHTFVETRETLMCEDGIELQDILTAMVGTLSNCIVLQGRFETMCEKWTQIKLENEELKKECATWREKFNSLSVK